MIPDSEAQIEAASIEQRTLQKLERKMSERIPEVYKSVPFSQHLVYHTFLKPIRLNRTELNRRRLASCVAQHVRSQPAKRRRFEINRLAGILETRCPNFPSLNEMVNSKQIAAGFSFAGFIYGGMHLLAWRTPFATDYEQLVWRVSASVIAGPPCHYLQY